MMTIIMNVLSVIDNIQNETNSEHGTQCNVLMQADYCDFCSKVKKEILDQQQKINRLKQWRY